MDMNKPLPKGKSNVRADRELDLRGDVCPITFVKSKLALEEIEAGQVLRVVIDYPGSVTNVPRSVANEGHKILGVHTLSERLWEILIEKVE
jgi:TusA-related sulfurtransferase